MDTYSHHALVCGAGGGRTIRHNALRDIVCFLCKTAGLNPEPEKAGLLRPRPQFFSLEEDGVKHKGSRGAEGRRPADVYIPCGRLGKPVALDLAVTSGLQTIHLKNSDTSWFSMVLLQQHTTKNSNVPTSIHSNIAKRTELNLFL